MAAGAALPGLFFCFAAMVLLVFVRHTSMAPLSTYLILNVFEGVCLVANMEFDLLPSSPRH